MRWSFCSQWLVVFITFIFDFGVYTNAQIETNKMGSPGNFEDFLRELGSMVYKSKKRKPNIVKRAKYDYTSKTTPVNSRTNNAFQFQKAALNDVLMMKLVSYYEDKYRLAHNEPTTESMDMTDHYADNDINRKKYKVQNVGDQVNHHFGRTHDVTETVIEQNEDVINFMENRSPNYEVLLATKDQDIEQMFEVPGENQPNEERASDEREEKYQRRGQVYTTVDNRPSTVSIYNEDIPLRIQRAYNAVNRPENIKKKYNEDIPQYSGRMYNAVQKNVQNFERYNDDTRQDVERVYHPVREIPQSNERVYSMLDSRQQRLDKIYDIIEQTHQAPPSVRVENARNMRKNNNDKPISEVVVI